MCATCGCSDDSGATITDPRAPDSHSHASYKDGHSLDAHSHPHDGHSHGGHTDGASADGGNGSDGRLITLEQQVLAKNDALAADNRAWLESRRIRAVNLMSSPGSGKTTLLERTIRDTHGRLRLSVVEGDQATLLDAHRIEATGCRVVQINTGAGCHLDAEMLRRALASLDPPAGSVVVIENVGNLVCPALFDLGETARVVVMSVTEGDDKPLKYPHMFRTADVVLLNKVDLLPYVDFDIDRFADAVRQLRPGVRIHEVSATRGDGMNHWYAWLEGEAANPEVAESPIRRKVAVRGA